MKGKIKQLKAKEGFTVIELIVVIAILGILVLLAMFAFNGYTEKARIAQIKNDVKVAEGVVAEYLMNNNSLPDTWTPSNPKDSVSDIYDTRGLVDEVEDGDYRLVPKSEFNTRLPGNFHANNNGKVYYEDDRREESSPLTDDEIADLIDEGFIPVASADELQQINDSSDELKTWGAGTKFEMTHVGGLDQKYIQVQDIDLSEYDNWLPIGVDPDSPFSGIYNGGNYLINNLNIEENTGFQSAGLFGSVSNGNVIISNIKMRNVNVDINSDYSSMLIGDVGVTGETTLSIMNVDIEGNVSGGGDSGGLIGFISYEGNSIIEIIKDITIKGDISSTGYSAGGIIGLAFKGIDTIENISIEGNISGSGSLGGLIGLIFIDEEYIEEDKDTDIIGTIKDITIKSNISSTRDSVGGIIGQAHTDIGTIENITIENDISTIFLAGGIIGDSHRDIDTIENITVKGDISSTGYSAGGLIGATYRNINTIENILIEGNISGGGGSGGLIGFSSFSGSGIGEVGVIKDITIKGDISSKSLAGGLIGEAYTDIDTIENIAIEGDISSTYYIDSFAGGIIGGVYANINTIENITIKGDISSKSSVGGIIGEVYTNIDTIENILIEGNISGNEDLGGLIGHINNGEVVTIKNITIKGDILSTDIGSSAGGLIGGAYTSIDAIENILIESIIKGGRAGGLTGGDNSQFSNIYDVKIINSEINGIENSGGLFGSLYNSALISKVLIKDTVIKSDSSHSGGLVGEIVKLTASDITIENSNITGALSTGGIAGTIFVDYSLSGINIDKKTTINGSGIENEGTGGISGKITSSTTSISDVNISADITGVDNVGELYGWVVSRGEGVIEDYHFDGTISGTGNNVGGPYGYIDIPN